MGISVYLSQLLSLHNVINNLGAVLDEDQTESCCLLA